MNTTKGGSEQERNKGFEPTVNWHKEPGYFYEENEEVEKDSNKPGAVALNAPKSTELHHEAQVNLVNSQDTKEIMTTTQNKNNKVAEDAVENDGVGVGVSQKDIDDWQSTLNEEEIAKAFDSGVADDYGAVDGYNNSGVVPVDPRNEGNLQSPVKNLGNLGGKIDVTGSSDRGAKLPDDAKLSDRNTDEQIPKHGFTESLEDESLMLGQDEKSTLPEERPKEVARLEKERNKLRSRLDKEKIIFDKLLVDKQELDEKTRFLGIGSEAADSLVKEIRNKEKEINSIEEKIKDIEQQITKANQTPEQAETLMQAKLEIVPSGDGIVKIGEGTVIGTESGLIEKASKTKATLIKDNVNKENVNEELETSNVETLEDGIKAGETILETIGRIILKLNGNGDQEEAKGMSFMAFGNFRIKYLDESVNKGMTKEEALSSWKNLLASLSPGDKVVVGLSEQGIELDIPVISGSEVSTDKVVSNNTVADDYNLSKAA